MELSALGDKGGLETKSGYDSLSAYLPILPSTGTSNRTFLARQIRRSRGYNDPTSNLF